MVVGRTKVNVHNYLLSANKRGTPTEVPTGTKRKDKLKSKRHPHYGECLPLLASG